MTKRSTCQMTQAEIARATGVTQSAIYLVEKRALRKIRQEIERQANLAGVTPAQWLFGDDDYSPED